MPCCRDRAHASTIRVVILIDRSIDHITAWSDKETANLSGRGNIQVLSESSLRRYVMMSLPALAYKSTKILPKLVNCQNNDGIGH
eukprot:scaffold9062_cov154-Amphora_coffeaeformis.AAC.1